MKDELERTENELEDEHFKLEKTENELNELKRQLYKPVDSDLILGMEGEIESLIKTIDDLKRKLKVTEEERNTATEREIAALEELVETGDDLRSQARQIAALKDELKKTEKEFEDDHIKLENKLEK